MKNKSQTELNMRKVMHRHMFLLQLTWEALQFSIEEIAISNSGNSRATVMEMALGNWGGAGR